MNIYLIDGDNTLRSYERLQEYIQWGKKKFWDIVKIDAKDQNTISILRSENLFMQKRMVVIDNYTQINAEAVKFINQSDLDIELIIYHKSQIPKTFIKKLKSVKKDEEYKLSKFLWKFIDSFYPGNAKACLTLLDVTVKSDPIELVFSILVGQLRDIFLVVKKQLLSYPPWRMAKLKEHAEKFGKNGIGKTIDALAEIDLKIKTSDSNLKDELDLFIATKLE